MRTLFIRFSSFGDVALCLPAISAYAQVHQRSVYLITFDKNEFILKAYGNSRIIPFYISFMQSQGFWGIFYFVRMVFEFVRKQGNEVIEVYDLHHNLRSFIFCFLFICLRRKVSVQRISKDRLKKIGLKVGLLKGVALPLIKEKIASLLKLSYQEIERSSIVKKNNSYTIGISLGSSSIFKNLPIEMVDIFIGKLCELSNKKIYFFGSKVEEQKFEYLFSKYPINRIEGSEFEIMKKLDLMITMDSFNLHMASLLGVPTYTLYFSTSPAMGFAPWKLAGAQHGYYLKQLDCQPCSVYGPRKCHKGTYACGEVEIDIIVSEIKKALTKD